MSVTTQHVGVGEGVGEVAPERLGAAVAVGLEDADDPVPAAVPGGGQHGRDLARQVGVVVDEGHAVALAPDSKRRADAGRSRQRRRAGVERGASQQGRRRRRRRRCGRCGGPGSGTSTSPSRSPVVEQVKRTDAARRRPRRCGSRRPLGPVGERPPRRAAERRPRRGRRRRPAGAGGAADEAVEGGHERRRSCRSGRGGRARRW